MQQVKQRKNGPKSIPIPVVGKEVPRKDLAFVRAVMHHFSRSIYLIEFPWEKHGTVETGVEGFLLIGSSTFYLNRGKSLVPYLFPFLANLVEAIFSQLLQVDFGLFDADKGRGDTGMNDFSPFRFKSQSRSDMPGA